MNSRNFINGYPADPNGWNHTVMRETVPDWLTHKMMQDILFTINRIKSNGLSDDDLMIYIPLHWIESVMRPSYRKAKLFGCDLRLNEYTAKAQVAINVEEKP